ncbi:MAG: TerB N-terminal domain-containing protein, partial [Verrucomicrobia bacterium]|nr:TerB N-terminal domain-containing protein [Verrucomicrobiota bacterium]
LYFYGMERRVLWDASRDHQAKLEFPLIRREILRLMEIYGQSRSFRGYASSLLDYLAAATDGSAHFDAAQTPESTGNRGVSFHMRLGLGLLAKSERPLPADWALAWLHSDPTVHLPTAASRCAEVFAQLFKAEYAKAFGEGLKLPENRARLKFAHRPASPSFSDQIYTVELDVPDVSVLSGPVNKLRGLAEACTERLDAYSRFVGRNPDQAESFDALLLLSPDLWPDPVQDSLKALRSQAIEGRSVFSLSDILRAFSEGSVPTKLKYTALSRALGSLGLGVEPDPRFGGQPPGMGDPILLFPCERLPEDLPFSADFASGALLLHLASAVAGCEGDVGEAEETLLLQHIEHRLHVSAPERHRLAARLQLYRVQPPSLTGLKKRIEGLDRVARESLGDFLLLVVQADGVVKPGEVCVLDKLWKLLGLEQRSLHARLDELCASEPVSLRKADGVPQPLSTPARPVSPRGHWEEDPAEAAARKTNALNLDVLFGVIFADSEATEAEERPVQAQAPDEAPALLLNLDPSHSRLLEVLLQRTEWKRAELEELCNEHDLMVDGAVEIINEAAFERFDQALIDQNGQTTYINRELIPEKMV